MPIVRNSFIQMSKLTNLKGRINYISSHARQENLYTVYETTERKFWTELSKCNREEFKKSGTEGKCIEARELIIALPESFVDYEPDRLLKLFTEHFKQKYGVECVAALHHNKRKTNYHIHLIFAERKLLEEPVEKIATRNMFYDEHGKHVRTKKEILDENGQIRRGCKVIPKGEVYERSLFTIKDSRFKSEEFLDEAKKSYTELINIYVADEREKLKVFDRNGAYLPMKKVGKNNPKAEQIEADNQVRVKWNQTVDRALVSGVPEEQILEVKQKEISQKAKTSIQQYGRNPDLFQTIIIAAIIILELLISTILEKVAEHFEKVVGSIIKEEPKKNPDSNNNSARGRKDITTAMPKKSLLADKFPRLDEIHNKLERQNTAIYQKEQQLSCVEEDIAEMKGVFKGKQRKGLQEQEEQLKMQIANMKQRLSHIVQEYGYKNVKEFLAEYRVAKLEFDDYQEAIAKWERENGETKEQESVLERLRRNKQAVEKREKNRERSYDRKDRGAR